MNKIKYLLVESTRILKSVKWDYAKMAQLVKLWGGPKKAALAFATITATIASVVTLSFQKLFKKFISRLTPKKNNNSDQNEIDKLIQLKTEEYLNNVQERKNNNLSTDDIDKEYNDFIKSLLENNNTTQQ